MGLPECPTATAEDTLCDILHGHGYDKALRDLRAVEERAIFYGEVVPDEEMMEHIQFLHVLIGCVEDLKVAEEVERRAEKKMPTVRGN